MAIKKKYQVFVSSTFRDLPEERQAVFQTLLKMDCIPAGMEFFGANDEEQLSYIRKVIEASDYYLVIVAGRYGSVTDEGISYTEKEFDCALELNIPVIALLHKNPDAIPKGKSEADGKLQKKLGAFRKRLEDRRLADYWESTDGLRAAAALAMVNARDNRPMPGWVRGDQEASVDMLTDLNKLHKEIEALKATNAELQSRLADEDIGDLAGLDEETTISGQRPFGLGEVEAWSVTTTWEYIFTGLAPHLIPGAYDGAVLRLLSLQLSSLAGNGDEEARIFDRGYQLIKIQLSALRLVEFTSTAGTYGPKLHWNLTKHGRQMMARLITERTRRRSVPDTAD